ncbi:hypothetical protein BDR07DRAFT_1481578 [Suillus spraguei]|nr:hypothetical protein BDR07DRAFT_1481578 [Suillus spraguei]
MPVIVSDDKSAPSAHIVSRPHQTVILSSRLTDTNNDATLELSIHRNKPLLPAIPQKPAQLSGKRAAANYVDSLLGDEGAPDEGAMDDGHHESKHLRHAVANTRADMSFDVLAGTESKSTVPVDMHTGTLDSEGFKCIDDTRTTVSDLSSATRGCARSDAVDGNGLLEYIDVQDINMTMKPCQEDKTMDISAFFGVPYAAKSKDGKTHNIRDCKSCQKKGLPHQIVSDTSTCRRHVAYRHLDAYCKWCKANKFESMLPSDVKERKNAATVAKVQQGSLDSHLHEVQPAAIEWLASTNQPIHAVDHPSFKKMIDTASCATIGILIPNRKATQSEITSIFKQQMARLKEQLNSKAVTGAINLT